MNKITPLVLLPVLAMALAVPAQAQQRQGRNAPPPGPDPIPRASPGNINAMFIEAEEWRAAGDCVRANALYYRLARRGQGFERSQYGLGLCLTGDDAATQADTPFIEGLLWLRRAAEAGLPDAQLRLAELYTSGPQTMRDPAEAAFWWTLFDRNGQRRAIGYVEPDRARLDAMADAFDTALLAQASQHADLWEPSPWIPHDEIVPPPLEETQNAKP